MSVMAHTVKADPVRTLANSLRSDLDTIRAGKANLRIDANSVENAPTPRRQAARGVRNAMSSVGLSQKAFAVDAKQTESVISEALSASRALALEWLYQQDQVFCAEWVEEFSRDKGLSGMGRRELKRQAFLAVMAQLLALLDEEQSA